MQQKEGESQFSKRFLRAIRRIEEGIVSEIDLQTFISIVIVAGWCGFLSWIFNLEVLRKVVPLFSVMAVAGLIFFVPSLNLLGRSQWLLVKSNLCKSAFITARVSTDLQMSWRVIIGMRFLKQPLAALQSCRDWSSPQNCLHYGEKKERTNRHESDHCITTFSQ